MIVKQKSVEDGWTPPSTHGLGNSERIIPAEHLDINRPLHNLNLFETIKIDIRNLKPLSEFQLNYISSHLNKENIMELIEIYNECFHYVEKVMQDF